MRRILPVSLLFACLLVSPASARSGAKPQCSDPLSVLTGFFESNEPGHFDESAKYLADDVTFATWATGVNGRMMMLRRLKGKAQLRKFLPQGRGMRWHLPDAAPDGPIYHETRISVSGSDVQLMLEPDRKRPDGKLYNPFSVEAVIDGCRITSLTVIERITWL